jgi:hypothetical protein
MLRIADDALGAPPPGLVGGHAHPIRLVNETAGGTIGWSWHPLLAPRRRAFVAPGQIFD